MSRRLRVCMVHYSDFHLDSRIQRQANALAERGDEVHLVCLSEPDEISVGDGTIRIHRVAGEKAAGGPRAYVGGYGRFLAGAARHVTRLSLRGGLDLVEVHNMPDFLTFAAVIPRLRGTPVILNAHDTFPELFATKFGYPHEHRIVRLIRLEERVSARLADHVITVTEEARALLAARGVGARGSSVVMNSPDEGVFGPRRDPRALPTDGPIRVLYHGGMAPRFGVEVLIRAMGLLETSRPVELRVCGSGEDRERLSRLAAEVAPGRVDISPAPVPFAEIPAELEAAHVGVVPTIQDPFTELLLPVKLLEYVHMGLPAVASRLSGITRYFGADDVWLFDPGAPESLARTLADVIARPAESMARAERAGERLAAINWPVQKAAYLELVDRLAAEAAGAITMMAPCAASSAT